MKKIALKFNIPMPIATAVVVGLAITAITFAATTIGTSIVVENDLTVGGNSLIANQGELRLNELGLNGNNYFGFKATSTMASNIVFSLPNDEGTIGQALLTNGGNNLYWGSPSQTSSGVSVADSGGYFSGIEVEAVLQEIGSRASTTINFVDDYGAVGDGVTDDSEAIQTAINTAGVGGTISFRSGASYLLDNGLIFTEDNQNLVMYGHGATLLRSATLGSVTGTLHFIGSDNWANSASKITIQNIIIDGGNVATGHAVYMVNAMRNIFRNVTIQNFNTSSKWAIYITTDSWNNYWYDVLIKFIENGIHIGEGASTQHFVNLETDEVDKQIMNISVSNNHKFTNCSFQQGNTDDDGTYSIDISGNEVLFDSCRFDGDYSGIWIDGQNDEHTFYNDATGILFLNSHFTHPSSNVPTYSVNLDHANKIRFVNSFMTPTSTQQPSVAFVQTTSNTDEVLFQNTDLNSVAQYGGVGTNIIEFNQDEWAFNSAHTFRSKRTTAYGNAFLFTSTNSGGTETNRVKMDGGVDTGTWYFLENTEVRQDSANGSHIKLAENSTSITATAGATVTWSNAIPAGAEVLGVATRVGTQLGNSSGTTGYKIGTAADPDRWGDITGVIVGTVSDMSDYTGTALTSRDIYTTATDIILTANGGDFDGTGTIKVVVFFRKLNAPTN